MASPDKPDKDPKPKKIQIEVNGNEIVVPEKEMTGAEIKTAAIEQNVQIQPNFVLQLELANGTSKVIADTEEVKLHNHMSFTAIAPDDNS
ncbi:MAG: multiubiquitin domain-containing protein [Novosphingobium sp.]